MPRINEVVENEKARVLQWGWSESKENKTPYLWMEFEFLDLQDEQGQALSIVKDFYFSDKAIEWTLKQLAVLGWKGKDIIELEPGHKESHNFAGTVASITTEMQSFTRTKTGDEVQTCKVKWINDPDYVPMKPLESTEIKKLSTQIKGKIAAYRSRNNADLKTDKKETPVSSEDNISF